MLNFPIKTAGIALALTALASSPTWATTITFEEVGTVPSIFSDQPEALDTEFAGLGVTFGGGWEILNEDGGFGVDAISGDNFAAYNTAAPGITDTITMAFDNTISSISGFLGSAQASAWTITASFDGVTSIVDVVNNLSDSYTTFSLIGSFDSVSIQGSATFGVLENLEFNVATVPLPASLPLIRAGLGGMGLMRRRKG